MNIHISDEIRKKWVQFNFRGKPFIINGKKYIRVKWRTIYTKVWWYSYEDDAAYIDKPK